MVVEVKARGRRHSGVYVEGAQRGDRPPGTSRTPHSRVDKVLREEDFAVPSHRLTLEKDPLFRQWLLEWDDSTFALKDPDGNVVFETDAGYAHRLSEIDELYTKNRIVFEAPHSSLRFQPQAEAAQDLKTLVEAGLRRDDEYRQFLKTSARRAAVFGAALFILGAGLFGGYVWVASWAPDPAPDHWLHWIGWLIGFGVLVLLSVALAGPYMCWLALRQYRRLVRIERDAAPPR